MKNSSIKLAVIKKKRKVKQEVIVELLCRIVKILIFVKKK